MSARRLLLVIDAEATTCGACEYAESEGCVVTGLRWGAGGSARQAECLAAERAYAEAVAQAQSSDLCTCGHTRGQHFTDPGSEAYLVCCKCENCGAYTPAGDDG